MFKKINIAFLTALILLAGVLGNAWAGEKHWWSDKDPYDHLWSNPKNWWPEGVPDSNDIVFIGKGDFWAGYPVELLGLKIEPPLIDSKTDAHCNWLLGPSGGTQSRQNYELNITGGRLVIGMPASPQWYCGWDIGCIGEGNRAGGGSGMVNISAGQVVVTTVMKLGGWGGTATLNMTGGSLSIGDILYCPYSEGEAHINLHGGTITAGDFIMDKVFIAGLEGKGLVNITGGKLIIAGNISEKIRGYVDKGWITAYDGSGKVVIDYKAGRTTVSARPGCNASATDAKCESLQTAHINIDCSQRLQRIDGFGAGALCGFGLFERGGFDNIIPKGTSYKTTVSQRKAMVDTAVRQLGLTHMRLFLFGCDAESTNDNNDPNVLNLDAFAGDSEKRELSLNAEGEDRRISLRELAELLDIAVPLGLENWIVTPGNMPGWLTELSKTNSRLFFAEYAEWAAGQLLYLKKIYKLEAPYWSMFNEPDPIGWKSAEWWIPWVKAVGRRFAREGLKTKIVVPDFMNVYDAIPLTEAILKDDEVRQYTGALAYHHYRSSFLGPGPYLEVTSRADTADAGKLYEQLTTGAKAMAKLGGKYNLPSWQTETAYYPQAMKDTGFSMWEIGRARANEIYYELTSGASAFETMLMIWVNVVDPRYNFPVRMEGHYIVMTTDGNNVTGWDVTKDTGAVLGHYGRYVRPGDYLISSRCQDWTLRTNAFVCEQKGRYVAVVINNSLAAKKIILQLDNMAWKPSFVGGLMTDEKNTLAAHPVSLCKEKQNLYETTLPPLSLCTFVWSKQQMDKLTLPDNIKFTEN